MPELRLRRQAREQLAALPRAIQEVVDEALLRLRANPRDEGVPLRGHYAGRWRMTVGGYRIIYRLVESDRVVIVDAIRRRTSGTYARRGS